MHIFKTDDKWILAVKGGDSFIISKKPDSIILDVEPICTTIWTTPPRIEYSLDNEEWEVDHTYREFQAGAVTIYTKEIELFRYEPYYQYASVEYFVSKDFMKKKIEWLYKNKRLAVHKWNNIENRWYIKERNFLYEDELQNESPFH